VHSASSSGRDYKLESGKHCANDCQNHKRVDLQTALRLINARIKKIIISLLITATITRKGTQESANLPEFQSRDHLIRDMRFPVGGPLKPSLYV